MQESDSIGSGADRSARSAAPGYFSQRGRKVQKMRGMLEIANGRELARIEKQRLAELERWSTEKLFNEAEVEDLRFVSRSLTWWVVGT